MWPFGYLRASPVFSGADPSHRDRKHGVFGRYYSLSVFNPNPDAAQVVNICTSSVSTLFLGSLILQVKMDRYPEPASEFINGLSTCLDPERMTSTIFTVPSMFPDLVTGGPHSLTLKMDRPQLDVPLLPCMLESHIPYPEFFALSCCPGIRDSLAASSCPFSAIQEKWLLVYLRT